MRVLGLSFGFHDAAAALWRDGEVVAAAREETFTRRPGDPSLPLNAINFCLQEAGITGLDLDHVVLHEKPYLKFFRVLMSHYDRWPFALGSFLRTTPYWLRERLISPLLLRTETGIEAEMLFVRHHLSHAAAAFLLSPFDEAAVLVADGVGEWATVSWGVGRGTAITLRRELRYPDSLGLLWAAVTAHLGLRPNRDEGLVADLAATGQPDRLDSLRRVVDVRADGSFRLDRRCFDFVSGRRLVTPRFVALLGPPRHGPEAPLTDAHRALAASLQALSEEILLATARHALDQCGGDRLCLGGGVFANAGVNRRLLADSGAREVFVAPDPGVAGSALGAAVYGAQTLLGQPRGAPLATARLGPAFRPRDVERALQQQGVAAQAVEPEALPDLVASELAAGHLVAWFHGRLEFGAAGLGGRSLLADPANPDAVNRLRRAAGMRPEAAPGLSVLQAHAAEWLAWDGAASPGMAYRVAVRPERRDVLPGLTGADVRLHTVSSQDGAFHDLLAAFHRRHKVPALVNAPFGDPEEILVCSPDEAVRVWLDSGADLLVLENHVARKVQ